MTDPDLVVEVLARAHGFIGVLLRVLLVNLFLQVFSHLLLLQLPLLGHHCLLVAATRKNVAVTLKLKVDPILEHSTAGLDVWEVLLRN